MSANQEQDAMALILEEYLKTKSPKDLENFLKYNKFPVPLWHLHMMNDERRNEFYEREISAVVKDKIVLDIGAGCGLLTHYAIKAGAKHVYALEVNDFLQTSLKHVFAEEIERGQVTLLTKHSSEIENSDFLHGHPEVVVHEIFGNNLVSEKVIETFQDLFARQIVDSRMEFVPQKFNVMGVLHASQHMDQLLKLNNPELASKFWFLEKLVQSFDFTRGAAGVGADGKDVSEPFSFLEIDMKKFAFEHHYKMKVNAHASGSFVRVWFNLLGKHGGDLCTDDALMTGNNHWDNIFYGMLFKPGAVNIEATYQDGLLFFKDCSQLKGDKK